MKRNICAGILLVFIFGLIIIGCSEDNKSEDTITEDNNTEDNNTEDNNTEENFHVYIAFGQSNMQGPGAIREQDTSGIDYSRWQTLNVVTGKYAGENRSKGQWYDAVPPLIIPDANLPHWDGQTFTTGLGPSDYFGRTLVENTPETLKIGIIAVANGDLALASFHKTQGAVYFASGSGGDGRENSRPSDTERSGWNRYIGAGYASIYDAIISNAQLAQEQGGVIKGIIVHQGESGRGLTYASWPDMLKEIYDDMLSDLNLKPNSIPILLGQTWNGGSGNTNGALSSDGVIKAVIPRAWIISSAGCNKGRTGKGQPDNIHFGSEDLETFGTRYGQKMLELNY